MNILLKLQMDKEFNLTEDNLYNILKFIGDRSENDFVKNPEITEEEYKVLEKFFDTFYEWFKSETVRRGDSND